MSYEFALVSAAVALDVDGGVIRAARVAAGGVGTIPWRLSGAEDALVGEPVGERAWRAAAETADRAVEGAQPLTHNAFKVGFSSGPCSGRSRRLEVPNEYGNRGSTDAASGRPPQGDGQR